MDLDHPQRDDRIDCELGPIVRHARQARGLTLAELGRWTGYSAAQVSRFERGRAALTNVTVLRLFADALALPPHVFGLTAQPATTTSRPGGAKTGHPTAGGPIATGEDGEDPVRRRQLLANLAVSAAAGLTTAGTLPPERHKSAGDLLVVRLRDAMLAPGPALIPFNRLATTLAAALADFHGCRYLRLADALPSLLASGHHTTAEAPDDPATASLLAEIYTLATRMLIKLDDQQLGWMAADRARLIAIGTGNPLVIGETARNLAILARKAGWYDRAAAIAMAAAEHPSLRHSDPRHAAERGLLIQSAAYTAARRGDQATMRELTDHAAAIAARLPGNTLLRDHGGGFSSVTVQLHRISAEYAAGDPSAAIAAASRIRPASLPTVERRARLHTDIARAYGQWGRRDECLRALLAAERTAPEETHNRPAVRDLISSLLVSGRTTPELRGLAQRCGLS